MNPKLILHKQVFSKIDEEKQRNDIEMKYGIKRGK